MPGAIGSEARAVLAIKAAHQHFVKVAVVIAREHHDPVAPGAGARKPHGGINRFRPGADETGAVVAGDFAEQGRRFHRQQRLRPHLEPCIQLVVQGRYHLFGRMAKETGAKAVQNVDIFIAIDIDQARAFRFHGDDLIDDLFPQPVEARRRARVGMHAAVLRGQRL